MGGVRSPLFPSSVTCNVCGTVNAKLKRERMWICPNCGTRHDRNLNAAINLRNLIMPVGRRRDGQGQESLISQQRDLPPLGAVTPGMEADAPQVWERDHRKLIMPPRRRRNGRSIEVSRKFLDRSRGLHAKANPVAGPATYPGPSTRTWSWNGGGGTQAWKLGAPGLERGHQPEEFDHARRPLPGWARPRASCQGEPGIVKDLPHLRGHGREPGMDSDKRRPQAPGVEAGITGT